MPTYALVSFPDIESSFHGTAPALPHCLREGFAVGSSPVLPPRQRTPCLRAAARTATGGWGVLSIIHHFGISHHRETPMRCSFPRPLEHSPAHRQRVGLLYLRLSLPLPTPQPRHCMLCVRITSGQGTGPRSQLQTCSAFTQVRPGRTAPRVPELLTPLPQP